MFCNWRNLSCEYINCECTSTWGVFVHPDAVGAGEMLAWKIRVKRQDFFSEPLRYFVMILNLVGIKYPVNNFALISIKLVISVLRHLNIHGINIGVFEKSTSVSDASPLVLCEAKWGGLFTDYSHSQAPVVVAVSPRARDALSTSVGLGKVESSHGRGLWRRCSCSVAAHSHVQC